MHTLEIRRQVVVEGELQQRNQTENSTNLLCINKIRGYQNVLCRKEDNTLRGQKVQVKFPIT